MLRSVLRAALVTVGVFGCGPLAAQPKPSPSAVDLVVKALSNPDDPSERFLVAYATKVAARIGNLDDFARLLTTDAAMQCNLLCEARLTPAYLKPPSSQTRWSELVRYVFTSTCYGMEKTSRSLALQDLEETLKSEQDKGLKFQGLFPSAGVPPRPTTDDGRIAVFHIGQAAMGVEPGFKSTATRKFFKIAELLQKSGIEWNGAYIDFPDSNRDELAAKVCKNSVLAKNSGK